MANPPQAKKPGMPAPVRLLVLVLIAVAIFAALFFLLKPLITAPPTNRATNTTR